MSVASSKATLSRVKPVIPDRRLYAWYVHDGWRRAACRLSQTQVARTGYRKTEVLKQVVRPHELLPSGCWHILFGLSRGYMVLFLGIPCYCSTRVCIWLIGSVSKIGIGEYFEWRCGIRSFQRDTQVSEIPKYAVCCGPMCRPKIISELAYCNANSNKPSGKVCTQYCLCLCRTLSQLRFCFPFEH